MKKSSEHLVLKRKKINLFCVHNHTAGGYMRRSYGRDWVEILVKTILVNTSSFPSLIDVNGNYARGPTTVLYVGMSTG